MFGFFSRKKEKKSFNIRSEYGNFMQKENETLLEGALRQHTILPHNCRVGTCQRCTVSVNGITVLACQYSSDKDTTLVYSSLWYNALIKEKITLGDDILKIVLLCPEINAHHCFIGQCIDLTFDKVPGSQRKYSIVNIDSDHLTLHIKQHSHGKTSSKLAVSSSGQTVFISKPHGNFKLPTSASSFAYGLAIATGSGMGVALALLEKFCLEHTATSTIIIASRKRRPNTYHNALITAFKNKHPLCETLYMTLEEIDFYLYESIKRNAIYIVCGTPELNQKVIKYKKEIKLCDSLIVQESF